MKYINSIFLLFKNLEIYFQASSFTFLMTHPLKIGNLWVKTGQDSQEYKNAADKHARKADIFSTNVCNVSLLFMIFRGK